MKQIPLKQLLQEVQQQESVQQICYKGNLLIPRFTEAPKDIIQNIIKNLTSFNEQIIKGYGGILINLLITYSDSFTVSFLFVQLENQIPKMAKKDQFGGHIYARLVCILTCFQSAIYSKQAQPDKCIQLLSTILSNKFTYFDNTANLLIYSCIQQVKDLIDIKQFVIEHFRNFLGVSILLEDHKVEYIDTKLIYDALEQSLLYTDNQFSKQLCKYFETKRNQLLELLDEISNVVENSEEDKIHYNHFIEFYNQVLDTYPEKDEYEKIMKCVRSELHFLLREQNSVSAQQREQIINLLTKLLSREGNEQFIRELIELSIVQNQFTFYLTKTFDKLCEVCDEQQRIKLLEYFIRQQNIILGDELTRVKSYISPILTLIKYSKELSKFMLEQMINQIIDHVHVKLCKSNEQFINVQLNLNESAKEQFKKYIIPIALSCKDKYQTIKTITSQIMMQNCNPNDTVYLISKQLEELDQLFQQNQLQINDSNKVVNVNQKQLFEDNVYIVGNMINFLYEYLLYCTFFKDFQVSIGTVYTIIVILIRMQQLLTKSEEDYGVHQEQLFGFLADFLLNIAKISQLKDFSLQILKKFASIVPDLFISNIITTLNLFENDVEDDEEIEEESEYEQQYSIKDDTTNQSNPDAHASQTDLFKFDQGDKMVSNVNDTEIYEETYYEEELEQEVSQSESNEENVANLSPGDESFISDEGQQKDIEINLQIGNRTIQYLQLIFEYNEGRGILWEVLLDIIEMMQKVSQDIQVVRFNKANNTEKQIQDFIKKALILVSKQNMKELSVEWFDINTQSTALENNLDQLYGLTTGVGVQNAIKEKSALLYSTILYKIGESNEHEEIITKQLKKIIAQCFSAKYVFALLKDVCQFGGRIQQLAFSQIVKSLDKEDSNTQWQIVQKSCSMILQLTNVDPKMQQQIHEFLINILQCLIKDQSNVQMKKKCLYEMLSIFKKYKLRDQALIERINGLKQQYQNEQLQTLIGRMTPQK